MNSIIELNSNSDQSSLIYLTGFMASGKSTVGFALADALKKNFYDLDIEIEKRLNKKIDRIFKEEGAAFFREIERDVLIDLSKLSDAVIALGGGTLLEFDNLLVVEESGILICLTTTPEETWKRIEDTDKRQLILGPSSPGQVILTMNQIYQRIETLISIRKPGYDHSDMIIDSTQKSVPQIVQEILIHLEPLHFIGEHQNG